MVFEELKYINKSHSKSIEDIKIHKKEIENKLPVLKSERENLWGKHKRAISSEDKTFIFQRINLLSDEISTLYGQRNVCKRIIETYNKAYKEYYREKELKGKIIDITKNKKIKEK